MGEALERIRQRVRGDPAFREQVLSTPLARLRLRPWREDDLDEVAGLWDDPAVVRYTRGQPPTRERAAAEAARP